MKVCLIGSILRQTVVSDQGEYQGWGGMTESAVAPFAALLDRNSVINFVGNLGKEDLKEVRTFFRQNYPIVNPAGIGINPGGTDAHYGHKDFVRRKVPVEPTRFEQIRPHLAGADAVIFNFGNIDDIDPAAIGKAKRESGAVVYVDVHRKPFGADENGYMYSRGWPGWEEHLAHADAVQMNQHECKALFRRNSLDPGEAAGCAAKVLETGAKEVFITMADKGVLTAKKESGEFLLFPAVPPAAVVDRSGCGDAFAAGYLTARHEGRSFSDAVKLGSVMASLNCEFKGYIKNISRKEIEKRLPATFEPVRVKPRKA